MNVAQEIKKKFKEYFENTTREERLKDLVEVGYNPNEEIDFSANVVFTQEFYNELKSKRDAQFFAKGYSSPVQNETFNIDFFQQSKRYTAPVQDYGIKANAILVEEVVVAEKPAPNTNSFEYRMAA